REYPLGVDVEKIDARRGSRGIAERYFAAPELDHLKGFDGEEYLRWFFRIWTLKETYIKARGLGLTLPLNDFFFSFHGSDPGRLESREIEIGFTENLDDDPDRWQFEGLSPTPDHYLSVAIERGANPDLKIEARDAGPFLCEAAKPSDRSR
ncbi:MAG: 4'-phosphopantetheinyl transferase superfamily protein, partial [Planctomycetes bacterium]|nr:4'-phosphopantetheinyl transferase superfamily protein [Planctomycetota bacterium]